MASLRNPTAPPSSGSEPFSAERYYSTQPAPASLEDTLEGVRKFVAANKLKGRRLVLVTVCPFQMQGLNCVDSGVLVGRNNRATGAECVSLYLGPDDTTLTTATATGFDSWTTSQPVRCRTTVMSKLSRTLIPVRHSRCDVCGILSLSRLCGHIHASTIQPAAFPATLLPLDEPVLGSTGY